MNTKSTNAKNPPARFRVVGGPLDGALLRVVDGYVQYRLPPAKPFREVLSRHLAREYPVDGAVWDWLRARGITRPSPSGARGYPGGACVERPRWQVCVLPATVERVRRIAEKRRLPLGRTLEAIVDEATP